MYAGHAALALLAKARRPRIPIALLVPIAFAPDWIEWVAGAMGYHNREISHSLISVGVGATVVALVWWLATRVAADAVVVWLTYASHWPADYITGLKPTWPGGPMVGLLLYTRPTIDMWLESALVVVCWLAYRQSLPAPVRRRATLVLVPLGLIAMQIGFEATQESGALSRVGATGAIGTTSAAAPQTRPQFSTLDSRFSILDSRLSTLDSRLSTLGSRLSALGSRLSTLDSRLSTLDPQSRPQPSTLDPQPCSFAACLLHRSPSDSTRANDGE